MHFLIPGNGKVDGLAQNFQNCAAPNSSEILRVSVYSLYQPTRVPRPLTTRRRAIEPGDRSGNPPPIWSARRPPPPATRPLSSLFGFWILSLSFNWADSTPPAVTDIAPALPRPGPPHHPPHPPPPPPPPPLPPPPRPPPPPTTTKRFWFKTQLIPPPGGFFFSGSPAEPSSGQTFGKPFRARTEQPQPRAAVTWKTGTRDLYRRTGRGRACPGGVAFRPGLLGYFPEQTRGLFATKFRFAGNL